MPDIKAYYSFRHTLDYRVAFLSNRIVWIDYQNGQHELFAQDIPEGQPRRLFASDGDDGEPVRLVSLSPSGRYLLVTCGDFSSYEECANPRRKIIPPKGVLKLLDTGGTVPARPLANTPIATIVPDESGVTWTRKGTVYFQSLNNSPIRELFQVRGEITSLHWSPDSTHLAFVCVRDEHSLLGLFTPGESNVQWISPGFDRNMNPAWSPDSSHIAFLRFSGPEPDVVHKLFSDRSDSFAVVISNIETKTTIVAWESSLEEKAGFSLQYGQRPLSWLDSRRMIFSHDANGWDHIYQFDLISGSCSPLTDGYWLVQDFGSSPDGNLIATSSNNSKQRYRYRLDIQDTSSGEQLNLALPDNQQYWRPSISHDNRFILFLTGGERAGCQMAYHDQSTGKTVPLSLPSPKFNDVSTNFVTPKIHTLKSLDSKLFQSQVFIPNGPGPFPAIVNIHGGPWMQSLPGFHPELGMSFQYAFCQLLAACGFLVVDINYRGSSGFGKTFRQAPERGWDGASEYQDVQAAALWLTRHPAVDRRRIGVIGESWGGYLAALALARDSGLIRAGVLINGCHNFPRELRRPHWGSILFRSDQGETATESIARAKIAEDSSPWGWLDQWMSPTLIVHGDDDRNISFAESLHLAHTLRCRSVEVESLVIPDEGHQLLLHESWLTIGNRTLDFLGRHLRG